MHFDFSDILALSYKNGLSTSVVLIKTFFIAGVKVPADATLVPKIKLCIVLLSIFPVR